MMLLIVLQHWLSVLLHLISRYSSYMFCSNLLFRPAAAYAAVAWFWSVCFPGCLRSPCVPMDQMFAWRWAVEALGKYLCGPYDLWGWATQCYSSCLPMDGFHSNLTIGILSFNLIFSLVLITCMCNLTCFRSLNWLIACQCCNTRKQKSITNYSLL